MDSFGSGRIPSYRPTSFSSYQGSSTSVATSASTNDQGQRIISEGQGNFRISGNVSGQAWPANSGAPQLTLNVDGKTVTLPLQQGQTPAQTAQQIQQSLPPGYTANVRASGSDLIVGITKPAQPPSGNQPQLNVTLANDPGQRVSFTGGNQLTISGTSTGGGMLPSFVNLEVDGQRVSVSLHGGETAQQTASMLQSALPIGYRASVSGTDPVTVAISQG